MINSVKKDRNQDLARTANKKLILESNKVIRYP